MRPEVHKAITENYSVVWLMGTIGSKERAASIFYPEACDI
jgi:hypothetical protein